MTHPFLLVDLDPSYMGLGGSVRPVTGPGFGFGFGFGAPDPPRVYSLLFFLFSPSLKPS